MNKYQELLKLKSGSVVEFDAGDGRMALCPNLGGRVFAELLGRSLHRIDLDLVTAPTGDFDNYGGLNFWPAPEGGKFGFNYKGDEWYVQQAINSQPFELVESSPSSATIRKQTTLVNRAGTQVEVEMSRTLKLATSSVPALDHYGFEAAITYVTSDSFRVINKVSTEEALIASWTLEQFDASDDTVAYVSVKNSKNAINFDFYPEHPGERITYYPGGFTYKTDGMAVGQIGIKKSAGARLIGFFDLSQKLLCIRMNQSTEGLYFNFADNDQPEGPYSAADNFSIYNSAPEGRFFEVETIGAAKVEDGQLKGSNLLSRTTFAFFDSQEDLREFLADWVYKDH